MLKTLECIDAIFPEFSSSLFSVRIVFSLLFVLNFWSSSLLSC